MPTDRPVFRWRPGEPEDTALAARPLARRLAPLAACKLRPAAELVVEASAACLEWARSRPPGWGGEGALEEWHAESEPFAAAHAWRAVPARWLETLGRLLEWAAQDPALSPAELFAEELGLWLGGETGDGPNDSSRGPWNGEPLAPGARLPDRAACGAALLDGWLGGEEVLLHGPSTTVALALERAKELGLAPRAIVSEGGPDLPGRRTAQQLAARGIPVRLVHDGALFAALPSADHVWLGTEAIAAHAFLGRCGTRALLREARRLEVPSALLATSDKVMPRGELALPAWCEEEEWMLWDVAPEGVRVESQFFETVPLDAVDDLATEAGRERPAQLALRSLPTASRPALPAN